MISANSRRRMIRKAFNAITLEFRRLGWLHITLWIGYSLIFFYGPTLIFDSKTAILMTLRTLGINAFIFYVNTIVLLPLLIGHNRFKTYILSIIVLLVGVSFLWQITDPVKPGDWEQLRKQHSEVRYMPSPNGEKVFPVPENIRGRRLPERRPQPPGGIFGRHFFYGVFTSLGMLFLSTVFWVILDARRKEKERLSLTNENLETEMKFLKSQMNPHFLFNALNNIYSLSQSNNPKTPQLLLKLSSMLRFIVYETDEHKIPIGREIDYIESFIAFQKIKLEEPPKLEIDFSEVNPHIKIEPMLIFPFVENAFKHSNIDDTKNGWMRITLKSGDNNIAFHIINSKPLGPVSKDNVGGIGLENVKKRLSFLYKDKYELNIVDQADKFEVRLDIKTA